MLSSSQTLKPPEYVLWNVDSKPLNFGSLEQQHQQSQPLKSSSGGGHSVTFDPGPPSVSRLSVHSASASDSGRYTCQPSSGLPASTHVHVALGNLISCKMLDQLGITLSPIQEMKWLPFKLPTLPAGTGAGDGCSLLPRFSWPCCWTVFGTVKSRFCWIRGSYSPLTSSFTSCLRGPTKKLSSGSFYGPELLVNANDSAKHTE